MKKMNLTITARVNDEIVETATATSISRMWVENKKMFAAHPEARVTVVDDQNNVIKDLILVQKKSGKAWMQNYHQDVETTETPEEENTEALEDAVVNEAV